MGLVLRMGRVRRAGCVDRGIVRSKRRGSWRFGGFAGWVGSKIVVGYTF